MTNQTTIVVIGSLRVKIYWQYINYQYKESLTWIMILNS